MVQMQYICEILPIAGSRMATMEQEIETILAPLRACVKEQGDLVRELKDTGKPELTIKKAVAELKAKKRVLEEKELELRWAYYSLLVDT